MTEHNIDDWCAELFGYKSTDQFFVDYKKKSEERIEKFLKKDTEGSMGPCIKCGSENTFPLEMQTRSGDEGKDFSINCGNCQARWKAL